MPRLTLQPMVHVQDMPAAIAFYESLGGELRRGSRDGDWALVAVGGGELSLLAHPPNPEQDEGTVELNFETGEPLEDVERALEQAGTEIATPTTDTGFGRQLVARSPDGLLVKINEIDVEKL